MFHLKTSTCSISAICLILILSASMLSAQSFEQTLPPGFLQSDGASQTAFPFNQTDDATWQWHYDSSLFLASGPILINEISFRPANVSNITGIISCSSLEVKLIEARTDVSGNDQTFANNIQRSEVVRQGNFFRNSDTTTVNGITAGWIPLRLDRSFLYDPTSGNDFIIELRICGIQNTLGFGMDGHIAPGILRRGEQGDCAATSGSFVTSDFAPIFKMDYTPVLEQTLPVGEMNSNSNTATNFPLATSNNQSWQWHYDSGQFDADGPITISQISVRADSTFSVVNAFDISDFEVILAEASTDYQFGNHDFVFANNIQRSKLVRTGPYVVGETASTTNSSSTWISFGLTDTFDFDPSLGNDFIVQIRSCGVNIPWGAGILMDMKSGPPGTVGGNRYGSTLDCSSLTGGGGFGSEFIPVIKISYSEREISIFPHEESFDLFGADHGALIMPPGWIGDPANQQGWETSVRPTSAGTTPFDHTTMRFGVGTYVHTDDSDSVSLAEVLESPIFDLSQVTDPIATFWLYSATTFDPATLDRNVLDVEVRRHNPGNTVTDFSTEVSAITLLQYGCWTKYSVDLGNFTNDRVSIRFQGSTDSVNSIRHDFALDDFVVQSRLASESGQAPRPEARLSINEAWNNNGRHVETDEDGPYYACAKPGGEIHITMQSPFADQVTALWVGPLNIGVADYGAIGSMDTGTTDVDGDGIPNSLFFLANSGNVPLTLVDSFFLTNPMGEIDVSFQLRPTFPLGVLATFQALLVNAQNGPFVSNAVVLELVP